MLQEWVSFVSFTEGQACFSIKVGQIIARANDLRASSRECNEKESGGCISFV